MKRPLSVACWLGGKAKLVHRLLPLFPPHRCYVEPFGGMASVLLNKPRAQTEIYNDRDARLFSLFSVMKYHAGELDAELTTLLKSRQLFETYREQTGITEIQRAARFLYCQALGFGGEGEHFGTGKSPGGAGRNINGLQTVIERVRERLQTVTIEHLDWEVCIEKYDSPETFFFCDPPYWGAVGYDVPFSERDQDVLADRLRRIRGRFLMTNTDCQDVRSLYRGLPWTVIVGQLSVPKDGKAGRLLRHLTVANYPIPTRGRKS